MLPTVELRGCCMHPRVCISNTVYVYGWRALHRTASGAMHGEPPLHAAYVVHLYPLVIPASLIYLVPWRCCPSQAAVLDGRLYVVGGVNESRTRLASVEALDPREGKWQVRHSLAWTCLGGRG